MAKTPEQVDFICNVFASYFLTDLLHMIFYSYEPIFYVHHCIPLALYYFGPPFFSPEEARTIYTVGFLLELTTPPISVVWILSKLGFKPRGYLACKVFAYLNFVVVRLILFPYYWYTTMAFWPKIVVSPFHVMNVYWFFAMTKYVVKSGND